MLYLQNADTINNLKACLVEVLVGRLNHLKLHADRNLAFVSRTGKHAEAWFILHARINSPVLHKLVPRLIFVLHSCVLQRYQQVS